MASILAARQALNSLRLSLSCRSASLIQRRCLAGPSYYYGIENVSSWKDPKSPSRHEHEVIFICVDASNRMLDLHRCFQLQVNSVRAYCRAKLKSNPRNEIGIYVMGTSRDYTIEVRRLNPTSDIDLLMSYLRSVRELGGGQLDFEAGMDLCWYKLDYYPNNPKRIVFFTAGPINFELEDAERYGKHLKRDGIAVDVVNFCLHEELALCKLVIETFVASANNNNNSLIKHVPPDSLALVRDVLSSLVERKIGNNEEFKLKNEAIAHEAYLRYGPWVKVFPGYFEMIIMKEKNKNEKKKKKKKNNNE